MAVTTFLGIVRNGKIEPATPIELPEGSEVYVVASLSIPAHVAKRKANGWLVGYVGNMLLADNGVLVQLGEEWAWRFEVFMTSLAYVPWGPIGTVAVNATDGAIIDAEQTKAGLYESGRTYQRSPMPFLSVQREYGRNEPPFV